ncbi:MAG: group II truncated hemoglobin [Alphaproteobacteria bacterium]
MRQTPYEMLGGEDGIRDLAGAFYNAMDRMETAHDIRAMHADNLDEIKDKLFEYLSGWLGGPRLYSEKYGTVCLTEPHAPFAIGSKERDQWLSCMDQALADIGADEELRTLLKQPFKMIANTVQNQRA